MDYLEKYETIYPKYLSVWRGTNFFFSLQNPSPSLTPSSSSTIPISPLTLAPPTASLSISVPTTSPPSPANNGFSYLGSDSVSALAAATTKAALGGTSAFELIHFMTELRALLIEQKEYRFYHVLQLLYHFFLPLSALRLFHATFDNR